MPNTAKTATDRRIPYRKRKDLQVPTQDASHNLCNPRGRGDEFKKETMKWPISDGFPSYGRTSDGRTSDKEHYDKRWSGKMNVEKGDIDPAGTDDEDEALGLVYGQNGSLDALPTGRYDGLFIRKKIGTFSRDNYLQPNVVHREKFFIDNICKQHGIAIKFTLFRGILLPAQDIIEPI